MQEGAEINRRMLLMTTLLLEYNADLSFRDDSGESACLLIFQSDCGLEYVQNILYQFINLDTYQGFQFNGSRSTMPAMKSGFDVNSHLTTGSVPSFNLFRGSCYHRSRPMGRPTAQLLFVLET
jgi:hypothetical protein